MNGYMATEKILRQMPVVIGVVILALVFSFIPAVNAEPLEDLEPLVAHVNDSIYYYDSGVNLSFIAAPEEIDYDGCRLWGIIGDPAPSNVIENHLLGDPPSYSSWPNCLKSLGGGPAGNNNDGWGIGYYSSAGTTTVLRGKEPAWTDSGFDWAVWNTIGAGPDIAVGHVRRSTNVVEIANPHPFERYRMGRWWLFGHNGQVIDKGKLRQKITGSNIQSDWINYFHAHPEDVPYCYCRMGECENRQTCTCPSNPWINTNACLYDPDKTLKRDYICGAVDSELYFIYLLKCIEEDTHTDWNEKVWYGVQTAVTQLSGSLNFFLTDGETLWAFRKGRPTLYYYDSSPSYCAVASTPPDGAGWTQMNHWEMAVLRKGESPIVDDITNPPPPISIPTPPSQPIWPEYTGYMAMTAPVIADFDPYYPGLEIISAVGGGKEVFVWHQDGTSMNKWSPKRLDALINPGSPPAIGDIDNDGLLDLVIAAGGDVYAFNTRGDLLPGSWPQNVGEVTSAPVLADLDNDGDLEVLVSSKDGNLYIWEHNGGAFPSWPKQTGEVLYRSPAVGDLNGDAYLEIVVGGGGAHAQAPFHVFVWEKGGNNLNIYWPKEIQDNYFAFTPSLADIDQDGDLEIVMGVGYDVNHGKVYAWNPGDGTTVTGWPISTSGYPFWCAISDLNPSYGGLEIVTSIRYDNKIYAWHYDGTDVPTHWPYRMGGEGGHSPAIGDINCDGSLEVVTGSYDGKVYAMEANGATVIGWPQQTGGFIQVSPAMGDIDNKGKAEIVQPSSDGYMYMWDPPGEGKKAIVTWPMLQHDERHTGTYSQPGPMQDPWTEINKELDELAAKVNAATMPSIIKRILVDRLEYAKTSVENAKIAHEAGNDAQAKKYLGVAKNQIESFEHMVKITRQIKPEDKEIFLRESAKIKEKMDALIESL
jgi:predicted glutamine amidotransferase